MNDISQIFSSTTAGTGTSTVEAKDNDLLGKEDFLTLLVAQLQNQDPLNPDDPTEFTSQLAEFSSLEQLQNLNTSMEDLASAQLQSERLGAMELIGREVVYPAANFGLTDGSATIGYQVDGTASSVTMYIQDENGAVVDTLYPTELSSGNHFIEWDGRDKDGNQLADGRYSIILQANAGSDDSTVAISPLVRSEVTGLVMDQETGAAVLQTQGGEVHLSDIIAAYSIDSRTVTGATTGTTTEENNDTVTDDTTPPSTLPEEQAPASFSGVASEVYGVTRNATSSDKTESAPMDEDQIARDLLTHHLSG